MRLRRLRSQGSESDPTSPAPARTEHRFWRALRRISGWLGVLLGGALIGAAIWIRTTFGLITVDQMLTNLSGGGEGVPEGYLSSFVWQVLVLPAVAILAAYAVARVMRWRVRRNARSRDLRPGRVRLSAGATPKWLPGLAAVSVLCAGAGLFAQTIDLAGYVRSLTTDFSLADYYVAPTVAENPDPKNLVVIYLESAENAFGDERYVEENAFAPLEGVTQGWQSIENLKQFDGGGWTMAGIVGTQCGVPLRGTQTAQAGRLDEIGAHSSEFMAGATCLGDVLRQAGYENVFLGGADASFASKGNFLRTHGFDEVHDLEHWREEGVAEESEWGASDRSLMEQAKDEIDRLHETGRPFNLTMLTLDSHEPVYLFDYCDADTEIALTSALRCSMEQVAGFVEHIEEQGYLDDTVVVLMGDHEKFVVAQSEYRDFAKIENRTIFNRIWAPDGAEIARDDVDQLSMYATMLDLLGFDVADHRAGVGVSATVPASAKTGMLALRPAYYREAVESRSGDLYAKLWGLPDGQTVDADFFDPNNPDRASEE